MTATPEAAGRRAVRVLPDAATVQQTAAEAFVERVAGAVDARGLALVALSGGSTPRGLHALLADPGQPYRARVPWEAVRFFWGDERPVPPDHADSNYRMARETLLSRLPVRPEHVHRIPAEDPEPARAAEAYARTLREVFAAHGRLEGGWPRFDLVLLGMGADGHTASVFPGTAAVHETTRWVVAPWVPKLATHRITLTPPVLRRAEAVVFLVTGGDKAAALAAVLEGPPQPDVYPSQVVRPLDGTALWLVDRAAAARLASASDRPPA
jgi:6-phosphogluconolactonase